MWAVPLVVEKDSDGKKVLSEWGDHKTNHSMVIGNAATEINLPLKRSTH